MPTKPVTTKKSATHKTPAKPRVKKKKDSVHRKPAAHAPGKPEKTTPAELPIKHAEMILEAKEAKAEKAHTDKVRYVFATGRRKTAIANVRLFPGKGENIVNKKPLDKYFGYQFHQEEIIKPFSLTGLEKSFYFTAHILGGGAHSQAGALRHGIATALGKASPEHRKILKKNGLLTRDDRKKERKKPGLKRARRSPQWAKR